jgi:hypothetical protein
MAEGLLRHPTICLSVRITDPEVGEKPASMSNASSVKSSITFRPTWSGGREAVP